MVGRTHDFRNALFEIARTEGLRGLCRGEHPSIKQFLELLFLFPQQDKDVFQDGDSRKTLRLSMYMSPTFARVLILFMTNSI